MLREYDQAWAHYRHIETTRNQYLGFFFTAILGSLGLLTSFLHDLNPVSRPFPTLSAMGIGWTLFLLSYFLFASVIKMGAVLRGYERVMGVVRSYFYEAGTDLEQEYASAVSVRSTDDPLMNRRLLGTQRSAEMIFRGACYAILAGLAAAGWSLALLNLPWWIKATSLAMPCSAALLLIYLETALLVGRGRPRDSNIKQRTR